MDEFVEEFKLVKAESIIKEFIKAERLPKENGKEKVEAALSVCRRRLLTLDDAYIVTEAITEAEWNIINSEKSKRITRSRVLDHMKV